MKCIINGTEREVKNVPESARYWVVARVDERDMQLWYWGSWEFGDYEKAKRAADDLGGVVLENRKGK